MPRRSEGRRWVGGGFRDVAWNVVPGARPTVTYIRAEPPRHCRREYEEPDSNDRCRSQRCVQAVKRDALRQSSDMLGGAGHALRERGEKLDALVDSSLLRVIRAVHTAERGLRDVHLAAEVHTAGERAKRDVAVVFGQADAAIGADLREVKALLHEYEIMFSPHSAIKYPRAHPAIRRPTREPALSAGMRYIDVSRRPLRPLHLDIESGREDRRNVCHLVAPLAGFAHRDPDLLLNAVRLDRGKVVVTVPGGQYRLEPTLPADIATGQVASIDMTDGHTLMAFIEKAFAVECGGYDQLEFRSPSDAMAWLGGRTVGAELSRDFEPDELRQLLSHPDRILTTATIRLSDPDLGSDAALARRHGAAVTEDSGHAFTLRHVHNGLIYLRNTWGHSDPKPIPIADFPKVFPVVYWVALFGDPPPPGMRVTRVGGPNARS